MDDAVAEKRMAVNIESRSAGSTDDKSASVAAPAPSGWMYRSWKLGPWTVPHYASPQVQIGMFAGCWWV